MCRRIVRRILNRPRNVAGRRSPRTRTSNVPDCVSFYCWKSDMIGKAVRQLLYLPSRASSKQCPGSQCEVYIVTVCPSSFKLTAASTIRRSAPPMPRSGWKKTTCLEVVILPVNRHFLQADSSVNRIVVDLATIVRSICVYLK